VARGAQARRGSERELTLTREMFDTQYEEWRELTGALRSLTGQHLWLLGQVDVPAELEDADRLNLEAAYTRITGRLDKITTPLYLFPEGAQKVELKQIETHIKSGTLIPAAEVLGLLLQMRAAALQHIEDPRAHRDYSSQVDEIQAAFLQANKGVLVTPEEHGMRTLEAGK